MSQSVATNSDSVINMGGRHGRLDRRGGGGGGATMGDDLGEGEVIGVRATSPPFRGVERTLSRGWVVLYGVLQKGFNCTELFPKTQYIKCIKSDVAPQTLLFGREPWAIMYMQMCDDLVSQPLSPSKILDPPLSLLEIG